ncbi:MAG: sigma-70 family RNA polymerase sigma factor [Bacteroidales bacterium]|nr:sigma-70 family RNA polymerase sigma factor [Bacteroidales bacterium]
MEFTKVYLDTYRELCLLALRYVHSATVAEDIVQEAFCKVLVRHPDVFRQEDASQVRAYMWKAVRNKAIDWFRKNIGKHSSLEEQLLDSELTLLVDELIAPESYGEYDYDIAVQTIENAVDNMPPRAREVFLLRREEGLSNKDVAQKLGVTVKAVEKQMTLSLKRIRQAFREKGIPVFVLFFLFLR